MSVTNEHIRYYADYQRNWPAIIKPLRRGKYTIEGTDRLSIHGDAPKSFVRIYEYIPDQPSRKSRWPGYIAKVGSKFYPNESITEQFLTRLGQIAGLVIADSQLRMVGNQVRFLSKYFLSPKESLVHGIEIFKNHLDEDMVEEIAAKRVEQDFYTFQTVCEAIRYAFPAQFNEIMVAFVEMLAFDTLVGNKDRHPANWGIITPISRYGSPRFSPVYDTARALFWNSSESQVVKMLQNQDMLASYVRRSNPQIGWDGLDKPNHFDLMGKVYRAYPDYRKPIEKFLFTDLMVSATQVLNNEFVNLMSQNRRRLILRCLDIRRTQFHTTIRQTAKESNYV